MNEVTYTPTERAREGITVILTEQLNWAKSAVEEFKRNPPDCDDHASLHEMHSFEERVRIYGILLKVLETA